MVIIVLLKDAITWTTPEVMFLRSLRLTRPAAGAPVCAAAGSLAIEFLILGYFFFPAIAFAGPLRVRAFV
jgi:hypothetical protein